VSHVTIVVNMRRRALNVLRRPTFAEANANPAGLQDKLNTTYKVVYLLQTFCEEQ